MNNALKRMFSSLSKLVHKPEKWPKVEIIGHYDGVFDIRDDVKYGLHRLPKAFQDIIESAQISFHVSHSFISYKDEFPELFDDINVLELMLAVQANATLLKDGKTIFIPQFFGLNEKQLSDAAEIPSYVIHECGHVVDTLHQKQNGQRLSDTTDFKNALQKDLSFLTAAGQEPSKFHGLFNFESEDPAHTNNARHELFAQLFAECILHSITPSPLMLEFPESTGFIETFIRNPHNFLQTNPNADLTICPKR